MSDDPTHTQDVAEEDVPEGYVLLPWHKGFGRLVGPVYEKREESGLTRAFRLSEKHTNGILNAHGGMLMTFADLAWGGANELEFDWWVTVRLLCDFLSGAQVGEWIEGQGKVVSRVDSLHTVEGRIWTGDKLVMTGTGIFKVFENRG